MRFETWCLLQTHAARLDVRALVLFLQRERISKERRANLARLWLQVERLTPATYATWEAAEVTRQRKERSEARRIALELLG